VLKLLCSLDLPKIIGAKINLPANLPTFRAAKLKGFTNKIVMPIILLRKKQLQFSTILCTHHQMDTSNLAYYLK